MLDTLRLRLSDMDASYLKDVLAIISSAFFIIALAMWILTGRSIKGPVQ